MDPKAESIARATVEIPRTPKPKAAESRARVIRSKLGENKTLDSLTEAIDATKPLERGNEASLLDSNFGINRRADGTKELSEPGSRDRHDKAENGLRRTRAAIEGTLSGADRAEIVSQINITFDSLPVYREILSGLSDTDRNIVVDNLLKDPQFLAKLRQEYGALTQPDQALADLVSEARAKLDEAQNNWKAKDKEYTQKSEELKKLKNERHELTTPGGSTHDELQRLRVDSVTGGDRDLHSELSEASLKRDRLSSNIRALEKRKNGLLEKEATSTDPRITEIDTNIASLMPQLRAAESELRNANENIARRRFLEERLSKLPDEIVERESEVQDASDQRKELEKARIQAQAEFSLATMKRVEDEENYASRAEAIVRNSLTSLVNDRLAEARKVDEELIEEEKAKSHTDDEKKVWDQVKKRWIVPRKPSLFNKSDKAPNRAVVGADWQMLRTGGEEAALRRMLEASGLTKAQVDTRMSDQSFVTKMGPEVSARIMREALRLGLVKPSDAEWMVNEPWAGAAVEKAKALRQELKDFEQSLLDEGTVKGGLQELLKGSRGLNKLGILMLIFAMIPGLVGIKGFESSLRDLKASNQ